jgi:hypothetical protein
MLAWSAPTAALAQRAADLRQVEIQSLSVRIDASGDEFKVIDARMDETATAAVFFGLVGATINSAANASEDDAKADPLRPTADALPLEQLIGDALRARLASRNTIALAPSPQDASHTLVVEIGDWGLIRRAQRPDTYLRPFLKLNLSLLDARGRTVWGPQREHSISQTAAELSAFTPETFRLEMEALAARAGHQVANRLIYR